MRRSRGARLEAEVSHMPVRSISSRPCEMDQLRQERREALQAALVLEATIKSEIETLAFSERHGPLPNVTAAADSCATLQLAPALARETERCIISHADARDYTMPTPHSVGAECASSPESIDVSTMSEWRLVTSSPQMKLLSSHGQSRQDADARGTQARRSHYASAYHGASVEQLAESLRTQLSDVQAELAVRDGRRPTVDHRDKQCSPRTTEAAADTFDAPGVDTHLGRGTERVGRHGVANTQNITVPIARGVAKLPRLQFSQEGRRVCLNNAGSAQSAAGVVPEIGMAHGGMGECLGGSGAVELPDGPAAAAAAAGVRPAVKLGHLGTETEKAPIGAAAGARAVEMDLLRVEVRNLEAEVRSLRRPDAGRAVARWRRQAELRCAHAQVLASLRWRESELQAREAEMARVQEDLGALLHDVLSMGRHTMETLACMAHELASRQDALRKLAGVAASSQDCAIELLKRRKEPAYATATSAETMKSAVSLWRIMEREEVRAAQSPECRSFSNAGCVASHVRNTSAGQLPSDSRSAAAVRDVLSNEAVGCGSGCAGNERVCVAPAREDHQCFVNTSSSPSQMMHAWHAEETVPPTAICAVSKPTEQILLAADARAPQLENDRSTKYLPGSAASSICAGESTQRHWQTLADAEATKSPDSTYTASRSPGSAAGAAISADAFSACGVSADADANTSAVGNLNALVGSLNASIAPTAGAPVGNANDLSSAAAESNRASIQIVPVELACGGRVCGNLFVRTTKR